MLREGSKKWDGGYVIAGLVGHGDAFVMRDPWGIRPAFYYYDDEIAVVTSERPNNSPVKPKIPNVCKSLNEVDQVIRVFQRGRIKI